MKKSILILLLLVLGKNIFAIDFSFSAGGGGLFGYTFTRYSLRGGELRSTQDMDRLDYGAFLFFDATFAVFSLMIQGGYSSFSENMILEADALSGNRGTGYEISLGFSLMGKYPFAVSERVSWFPMIGLEYHVALLQRRQAGGIVYDRSSGIAIEDRDVNGNPYPLSAWNSLWINIGAGMDHNIIGSLFLRAELLFGIRLPTRYERGALEVVQEEMGVSNPRLRGLTGNPTFKIGLGYRF